LGRKDGLTVIWPAYFDIDRSRAEGRVIPKNLAIESPTAEEIYEVCSGLKKSPVLEDKRRMPGAAWAKPGRVLIKNEGPKLKALKEIAASLQRKRSAVQKKESR
jgi:signal recognition particle subunit SRP19